MSEEKKLSVQIEEKAQELSALLKQEKEVLGELKDKLKEYFNLLDCPICGSKYAKEDIWVSFSGKWQMCCSKCHLCTPEVNTFEEMLAYWDAAADVAYKIKRGELKNG